MTLWLLAALGLYLLHIHLPGLLLAPRIGVKALVGPRDDLPAPGILVGRAQRATANLQENLPFFLTLGLLALILPGTDMAQATLGAAIFVLARAAYLPLYLAGIPGTRSIAYWVGIAGNAITLLALI
jgi:uncharacterized MAPEG superfamily protein